MSAAARVSEIPRYVNSRVSHDLHRLNNLENIPMGGFTKYPTIIMKLRKQGKLSARASYLYLDLRMHFDDQFPTQRELARLGECSCSTISEAIAELQRLNIINPKPVRTRRGKCMVYHFTPVSEWLLDLPTCDQNSSPPLDTGEEQVPPPLDTPQYQGSTANACPSSVLGLFKDSSSSKDSSLNSKEEEEGTRTDVSVEVPSSTLPKLRDTAQGAALLSLVIGCDFGFTSRKKTKINHIAIAKAIEELLDEPGIDFNRMNLNPFCEKMLHERGEEYCRRYIDFMRQQIPLCFRGRRTMRPTLNNLEQMKKAFDRI